MSPVVADDQGYIRIFEGVLLLAYNGIRLGGQSRLTGLRLY